MMDENGNGGAALGLSGAEAEKRKREGQANQLPGGGENSVAAIVRRNVFTLFNLLNLVLALLVILVGSYRNLLFMGVVVSNIFIGLVQELRAKRTHDRLLLLSEGKIRALRDGAETRLPPAELVLGDVALLRRGDQVPADGEILSGRALVNESLLTGESEPIEKKAGDQLLSGSYLTEGNLTLRLTAVGEKSYAGGLQTAARRVKRPRSELMESLNKIIRAVSIALIPIGLLLYWKQAIVLKMPLESAVPKTVAAMLGMIPEGLILLSSVALAVGVVRLGRKRALVNELYGIESLARVDLVCLDKTGTLTSGKMRVKELVPLGGASEDAARKLMAAFADAFRAEEGPTQTALNAAFPPAECGAADTVVPFSSDRKWSAARYAALGSLVLGAPEKTFFGGGALMERVRGCADKGLRVLLLQRSAGPLPTDGSLPEALSPVALILIEDELRPNAAETIRYFGENGVALKVLSGDSPLTVSRIALAAGLPDAEKCLDLSALPRPLPYDELAEAYTVFGRVSPEDKRELVRSFKKKGRSVAMIGDGVNDIPALKAADCSIAMAGGSDAACRSAQLTLLDADFSVIPDIVLEGRRVINNITRAASLFLVKNIFSCLIALSLLVLPCAYPFQPIQLTLVSSLTIGFPSFVLALMPEKSRVKGDFIRNVLRRALPGGVCVTLFCLGAMLLGEKLGLAEAEISTLCTLIAAFSGWCVLVGTCRPFNTVRAALCLLMAAAIALSVLLMPGLYYLVPLSGGAARLLVGAFCLTPILLFAFGRVMRE